MRTHFVQKELVPIIIIIVVLTIFFTIHKYFYPYGDYNPLDPEPKTGTDIMAERWPRPEPNDPNFLRDYEEHTGHKWETE